MISIFHRSKVLTYFANLEKPTLPSFAEVQYPITEYSGYAERNVINCIIVVSRERREERDSSMSQSVAQLPSFSIDGPHTVVKVFLVNGESRSLRLDERTDVNVSPPPPPPPPPPDLHHPRRSGRGQIRAIHRHTCMALMYTTPVLQMTALR